MALSIKFSILLIKAVGFMLSLLFNLNENQNLLKILKMEKLTYLMIIIIWRISSKDLGFRILIFCQCLFIYNNSIIDRGS